MKRIFFLMNIFLSASIFSLYAQHTELMTGEDKQMIKTTALNYFEGWYTADTSRMAEALSPELKKRGIMPNRETGELFIGDATYAQMIEWTGNNVNMLKDDPNLFIRVEILDTGKNIATVKITSPDYLDYVHMGKMNGEWKIYNVLWEPNYSNNQGKTEK